MGAACVAAVGGSGAADLAGILVEAEHRGYQVREYGGRRDAAIVLVAVHEQHPVWVGESGGGLALRIGHRWSRERDSLWRDEPGLVLERRLDEVFVWLERGAQAELDKEYREHQQFLQDRVMWRIAMREARLRFAEDYRLRVLHARVADQRQARRIRAYAAALRERAQQLEASRRDASLAWVTWAFDYADQLDHEQHGSGAPLVPEPEPEQLKPFLDGWSPHGPRR